jgi:hypothetical protein
MAIIVSSQKITKEPSRVGADVKLAAEWLVDVLETVEVTRQ